MQLVDLRPDHLALVHEILRRFVPKAEVSVFGSRAKWLARETSDLDLCIREAEPLGFKRMGLLMEAFEESNLPYKVDVVDWATTSEGFRKIIERDKVVVQKANPVGRVSPQGVTRQSAETLSGAVGLRCANPTYAATLENVCSLIADCPHSTPFWTDTGFLVIRNQNIKNGKLDLSQRSYTDHKHYLIRIHRAKPQFGDLIFTREAPMGDVCMVPEGLECCVGQRQVLLRPNPEKVEPRFLLYAIQSPEVQHEISWSEGTGSTVSNVRIPVLKSIKIPLLPLKEQVGVATLLGAIDDRITLLRETNATLEAIAQALFKSWFVDFDPVHAKQQGRAPEGMDEATAALFPDSFEESEMGLVPKGWRVAPLDSIANFLNGLALQKFPPESEDDWLPVIKIAQLRKGDTAGADRASTNIKQEYIVQNGDVLFSWSGSLEVEIWCGGAGALNQHLFKVTSADFSKWFYFFWTRQHLPNFQQIAASKATTMGHIQRKHLTEAKVVVPADDVMSIANDVFEPLLGQLINNALQAQTLATLRDTLLPRLISGQLRLPELEAMAEEALA